MTNINGLAIMLIISIPTVMYTVGTVLNETKSMDNKPLPDKPTAEEVCMYYQSHVGLPMQKSHVDILAEKAEELNMTVKDYYIERYHEVWLAPGLSHKRNRMVNIIIIGIVLPSFVFLSYVLSIVLK